MQNYYDGINQPLLANIPPGVKQVLELGCANGRLGEAYKANNPGSIWTGIEYESGCIRNAAVRLDKVVWMDLNTPHTKGLSPGLYDMVVAGDVLEHLVDPGACLAWLYGITTGDAQLRICVPNMSHYSIYEKMLTGDITYDPHGLLDNTHLRWMSYSSIYKLLLDNGWLPHLLGAMYSYPGNDRDAAIFNGLIGVGESIGIPRQTLERNLSTFQLIISATKSPSTRTRNKAKLSVVIPMNNSRQFDLNVIRSGGLHEIGAQIIPIDKATSAAEALERGKEYITGDWILFCHQDVFTPHGSGYMLSDIINSIPAEKADQTLVGFAGLNGENYAGLVVDRAHKFDYPAAFNATSLDEFAILLSRNSLHRLDPAFGWHGWGTDLCLAAKKNGLATRIERVPFFHNSVTANGPTPEFNRSIDLLKQKYSGYGRLVATTGIFDL